MSLGRGRDAEEEGLVFLFEQRNHVDAPLFGSHEELSVDTWVEISWVGLFHDG